MNDIRLACCHCDREDMDGITSEQLEKAVQNGWTEITRVQNLAQSLAPVGPNDPVPSSTGTRTWGFVRLRRRREHLMDPDAAFSLLKDQIENAQWHEAAETAENFWNGCPKGDSHQRSLKQIVDRIIAESTCRAVASWEVCV